jgi:hypothetical protein
VAHIQEGRMLMIVAEKSFVSCALALACGCSSPADPTGAQAAAAMPEPLVTGAATAPQLASTDVPGSALPTSSAIPQGAPDQGLITETETTPAAAEMAECASSSTGTSLQGVVLAFTFDVSGSMGSYSQPYFDRNFKWEPVVEATKAFFSDATSAGVSASLTFFPNELAPLVGGGGGNEGDACNGGDYAQPDVSVTPLPSADFSTAIDAITPVANGDWRQGTPTGPALEGTIAAIEAMRAVEPNAKYVIVLVTDGEPALCSNEQNDIDYVAGVAASVAEEIPTYVIGLGNPVTDDVPNPPTNGMDNLHAIAAAGGTGEAFLVDTDDPAQTSIAFRTVIDSIRENSFNCALEIPAPPSGLTFDSTRVNVNYQSLAGANELVNDPTCTAPSAWYYDDPDEPSAILLCDSACTTITSDSAGDGQLNVEFGCLSRVSEAK